MFTKNITVYAVSNSMQTSEAVVDKIKGEKAVVLLNDGTHRQIIMDKDNLPEIAREEGADLDIHFNDGTIVGFDYVKPEEREKLPD